jgi:hypothetical protein
VFTFHALFTNPFRAGGGKRVNTQQKYGSTKRRIEPLNHGGLYQSAGDLEDVRTLRHNNEYLVKAIYHFFRSVCESPSFTLSDWFMSYHSGSMDDLKN